MFFDERRSLLSQAPPAAPPQGFQPDGLLLQLLSLCSPAAKWCMNELALRCWCTLLSTKPVSSAIAPQLDLLQKAVLERIARAKSRNARDWTLRRLERRLFFRDRSLLRRDSDLRCAGLLLSAKPTPVRHAISQASDSSALEARDQSRPTSATPVFVPGQEGTYNEQRRWSL